MIPATSPAMSRTISPIGLAFRAALSSHCPAAHAFDAMDAAVVAMVEPITAAFCATMAAASRRCPAVEE